ncbi:MAG: hypothetical protein RLZ12_362 [Bacillota bacterium]|jgi:DNA-3-methyladenine glycosylase
MIFVPDLNSLPESFYDQHVVQVAKKLLGQLLVFNEHEVMITETEAYRGTDDEASHAYRGVTPRNQVMFGEPGRAYVYLIYGMYYCFNIVCEPRNTPAAVLLRGAHTTKKPFFHYDGPGKLCRALGITSKENKLDLTTSSICYVKQNKVKFNVQETPRIGIKKALEKKWRFVLNLQNLGNI